MEPFSFPWVKWFHFWWFLSSSKGALSTPELNRSPFSRFPSGCDKRGSSLIDSSETGSNFDSLPT